MSKKKSKQKQQQKKEDKQKKKKDIEKLVNKHLAVCIEILDEAYSEILGNLDDANNQLLVMSNYLVEEKQTLQTKVKTGDYDGVLETIENSYEVTDEFIRNFTMLTIPKRTNSVATPLAVAGDKASKYLERVELDLNLEGNKNSVYITSLVVNRLKAKSNEYSDLVCKDFYVDNPYISMFSESLSDYTKYIKAIQEQLNIDDDIEIEEVEIGDKKINKIVSNSRIRVTHTDMMNFAKSMGYEEARQTNSTHRIWKHKITGISLPIPAKGGRTLPQGTMSRMLKQMNLKRQDLVEYLANN